MSIQHFQAKMTKAKPIKFKNYNEESLKIESSF